MASSTRIVTPDVLTPAAVARLCCRLVVFEKSPLAASLTTTDAREMYTGRGAKGGRDGGEGGEGGDGSDGGLGGGGPGGGGEGGGSEGGGGSDGGSSGDGGGGLGDTIL